MRNSARTLAALVLALGVAHAAVGADKDEDNPHEKMVRSKSVCIDCHTRVPKAGEHAADYFLVDTPSENCLGCHGEYEHAGVHEHLGKDPGTASLPVDEHGKIACFTCHDPHPAGLLPGRTVYQSTVNAPTRAFVAARAWPPNVERRAPSEAFGGLLRTPPDDAGCPTCHASTKESPWREKKLWSEYIRVWPRQ